MTKEEAQTFAATGLDSVLAKARALGFTDVKAEAYEQEGRPVVGMKAAYGGKNFEHSCYVDVGPWNPASEYLLDFFARGLDSAARGLGLIPRNPTPNRLAQVVRDGFGPDFSLAADVIATMLERHISADSPQVPSLDTCGISVGGVPIACSSRDGLIKTMAVCFRGALQMAKGEKRIPSGEDRT